MTTLDPATASHRLCYILHLGLVEIRALAGRPDGGQRIHDLADALETLPRLLGGDADDPELARFVLTDFERRHPDAAPLSVYLDAAHVPERF